MIMLENKIAVTGIDHGYGNIKTAGCLLRTGIIAYDEKPAFDGNILEYEGKYYRIGEGHKGFIADKSVDEDYYLLTLAAVARELNRNQLTEADVYLATGLPLSWVRTQRKTFREYLMRNKEVRFRYNGKDYHVRFVGCSVLPQGFPAVAGELENMKGVNLLADIGNGTMNILYIVDKSAMESKSWTEKYGVNQCVIAVKNAVLDKYGSRIDDSIIEQVLRTGTANIGQKYLDCITDAAGKYTNGIFEMLYQYDYNPELMHLYVVGGGGCLIKNFGTYDEKQVTFNMDICAAAKGYEILTAKMLRSRK